MTRNNALLLAAALLVGIGIGYWAAVPKNNLEPVENNAHSMMSSGAMSATCPMNTDSSAMNQSSSGMSMEQASPEELAAAEKELAADPKNIDKLVEVARQKRRLGKAEESESDLKKALSINANHPGALFEMAVLAMHESGDNNKAIEYFEKYLKVEPMGAKSEMAKKAVEALKAELNK